MKEIRVHGCMHYQYLISKSNDTTTNSCTNVFCTNWCDIIRLVELNITWPTWFVFINLYFHSTNDIMPRQFVQNKFVLEFVAVSLLICTYMSKDSFPKLYDWISNSMRSGITKPKFNSIPHLILSPILCTFIKN